MEHSLEYASKFHFLSNILVHRNTTNPPRQQKINNEFKLLNTMTINIIMNCCDFLQITLSLKKNQRQL